MNLVTDSTARLAAVTVLLGALIVILSQVVAAYSLEDQFGNVITNITLLDKHGPLTTIFGLIGALALVYGVVTGSRAAIMVLIAIGLAVLLTFLFIDLPDVGDTGMYDTPGQGLLDATSTGAAGLWLELTGGLVLILGGVALATLSEEQLRAIGPSREPGPRRRPARR